MNEEILLSITIEPPQTCYSTYGCFTKIIGGTVNEKDLDSQLATLCKSVKLRMRELGYID